MSFLRRVAQCSERIRRSLSRVTSSGRFIPTIDGLRFVAISAVVLYHLNGFVVGTSPYLEEASVRGDLLYRVLDVGGCGVRLFFTISGFILALPFAEYYLNGGRPVRLGRYYARRVTRLEPPYLINLLLVTVLILVVNGAALSDVLPHLGASMVYLHNLIYGTMSTINGVAWSLEVEVQFYIAAPLLAWMVFRFAERRRRAGLMAVILALIVAKVLMAEVVPDRVRSSLLFHLDHFLVGFLLADVYIVSWKEHPRPSWVWDIIGTVAWAAVIASQLHPITHHMLPIATFAAYVGAFRGRVLAQVFRVPWLVTVGGMCYTIYLYHFFIISLAGRWTVGVYPLNGFVPSLLVQAVLILPVVFAVSAGLFLVFEKPFMYRHWPRYVRDTCLRRQAPEGA